MLESHSESATDNISDGWRALITRDTSGSRWVYILPSVPLLFSIFTAIRARGRVESPGFVSIDWTSPQISLGAIVALIFLLAYALYPTILGWSLIFVPVVVITFGIAILPGEGVATRLLVVSLTGAVWWAYWAWRPRLTSARVARYAILLAFVIEGWYFMFVLI